MDCLFGLWAGRLRLRLQGLGYFTHSVYMYNQTYLLHLSNVSTHPTPYPIFFSPAHLPIPLSLLVTAQFLLPGMYPIPTFLIDVASSLFTSIAVTMLTKFEMFLQNADYKIST
jgi:hypothetical protein